MRPTRIAILLSGSGRTMVNISEQINAGRLNAEIAAAVSSRTNCKGNKRAEKLGLTPEIIRPRDYADVDKFSGKIDDLLREREIDLAVQAGWLCYWKIPSGYENRVMNIHPALLPSFGGKGMWGHHVHEAVLKRGCKVSGCTVHFCSNEYDAGPIILQRTCPVFAYDSPETLADRVFEQERIAYPEAIELFCENRLTVQNGIVHIKASREQNA
ncbi:phosphoribosylglycinamide formyltransferase [Sedimentisphaera salicampi]|uniref:phosphoribosylglycinamide formyltransferase 1 n=1 Tax=Sedimentisphaera salicampi TaxID=1941349 RepID=A0A1W6LJ77_9BACT|nr:phosphoribosylglycinamide formyltransferase [Sedimentisphaera salicampi]ARN55793.1 Phosphoribosylglycinamide formyltransferase [Sedimentisphaera salicampi]OXU15986.1 Phosphoribosylglycinamide formyltransferase [Sedimentisphaera salicampi]